jgi:hypothetical protein
MANFQITGKTLLTSVDRAADSLLIYDASASALKRTVVDNLLDLTSHPVGIDDVQTLTNKILTTPTITVRDNVLTIQDNADTTKQAQFQLSSITTGTTRTYTLPDVSAVLATRTGTETLTNKTLTSPTITTATISNPTLTVDTVSEFTAANGVNIDGLLIKDGLLPAGNIQPLNLVSGTGSTWVWQTWSPTWTNITVGNGTVTAKYTQIGKTVVARISLVFGSTTAVTGTAVSFTLPVTAVSYPNIANDIDPVGSATILDNGTASFNAQVSMASTTTARIDALTASGTYVSFSAITSTVPMTWTTNDALIATIVYEAA